MDQHETFEWLRERSNRLTALEDAIIEARRHSHSDVPEWNQSIERKYWLAILALVEPVRLSKGGA